MSGRPFTRGAPPQVLAHAARRDDAQSTTAMPLRRGGARTLPVCSGSPAGRSLGFPAPDVCSGVLKDRQTPRRRAARPTETDGPWLPLRAESVSALVHKHDPQKKRARVACASLPVVLPGAAAECPPVRVRPPDSDQSQKPVKGPRPCVRKRREQGTSAKSAVGEDAGRGSIRPPPSSSASSAGGVGRGGGLSRARADGGSAASADEGEREGRIAPSPRPGAALLADVLVQWER